MMILKAYLDNSGEENDPQHRVCSIAGYVTTVNKWRKFYKLWKQTLTLYKVPYLHMKEFAHNIGPFEKFKNNEENRRQFIRSLINVMEETHLRGIMSVIRLADFRRFNEEKKLNINALAFNLYICMSIVSLTWKNKPAEIIVDRINNAGQITDKARKYADTDVFLDKLTDCIQVNILRRELTFKEIIPIQAADFLAWEIRKHIDSKDEWFSKFKIGDDPTAWNKSMKDWSGQKGINIRKSYEILSEQTYPYGFVWDYRELCALDKARNYIWP
jgi:hypothetical protein